MMRKCISKIGKGLFFCLPLLLGIIGLVVMEGQPVVDSLFACVTMYVLGYSDAPANICVELARWIAPVVTASWFVLAIAQIRNKVRACVRDLKGNSVAVYGPAEKRAELLTRLGGRGINGGDGWTFVRAQNYLLLGGEEENFGFYERSREKLAGRTVYLQCRTLPAQSVSDPSLRLFCPEETAARLFWKRRCLYQTSVQCGHRMSVVLLGFGKLGEKLLTYALQDNIFDPDQHIEYHVFGGGTEFSAVHTELSSISDPVIIHDEPWYENRSLLEEAQMVVVLDQEDQLALVRDLLFATTVPLIDVFAAGEGELELLAGRERLRLFRWKREAWDPIHIFGDTLFDRAKRINLRYAHLYSGVPENAETRETEWEKLDAFTRYSNVSAADYHEVRLNMLSALGWSVDAEGLSSEQMELLAELEHIRWCRYHYLNNWKHGIPENGARKDPNMRIHADLVPYDKLTEGEKQKDRDNIRVLLSIH